MATSGDLRTDTSDATKRNSTSRGALIVADGLSNKIRRVTPVVAK